MSRVTDRTVRFVNETMEEAYESRAVYGAPDWQVDAWVSTYTGIAAGEVRKGDRRGGAASRAARYLVGGSTQRLLTT